MNLDPIFLSLAEIVEIHKNQIELYGGDLGIRDISLLVSALAVPESTFQGQFLHNNLFEMAAAYAYHICMNHPFLDGNKRTALVSALVFFDFNGIRIEDPNGCLYEAMMSVASGKKGKDYLAGVFEKLSLANSK